MEGIPFAIFQYRQALLCSVAVFGYARGVHNQVKIQQNANTHNTLENLHYRLNINIAIEGLVFPVKHTYLYIA